MLSQYLRDTDGFISFLLKVIKVHNLCQSPRAFFLDFSPCFFHLQPLFECWSPHHSNNLEVLWYIVLLLGAWRWYAGEYSQAENFAADVQAHDQDDPGWEGENFASQSNSKIKLKTSQRGFLEPNLFVIK